jgi:hypothetical protein
MKRSTRAGIALFALTIAGGLLLDLIVFGSDEGYKVAQAQGVISGFVLFAVSLFAWNIATYKK